MRSVIAAVLISVAGPVAASAAAPAFGPHVIYGFVKHVAATTLNVERRNGRLESVDITAARAVGRTGVLYVGRAVALYGDFDRAHHYHVNAIMSAYGLHHGAWPPEQ